MCCSIKHLLMLLALPVFFYAGMCFERSYKMIKEQTVQMKGSWQEKTLRLSAQYTTTNHLNDNKDNSKGSSVVGSKVPPPSNNVQGKGPPGEALPQQQQQQQQWQQQSKIRLQQQPGTPSAAGAVPGQPGTVPPQQQHQQQPNRWQLQTKHPKPQGIGQMQHPKTASVVSSTQQQQQQQQPPKNNNKPGDKDLVVPKKVALKRKKKVGVNSEGTTDDNNSDKENDNNQELSVAQQHYEKRKKSREEARANANQSREEAMAKAKQIKATAGVSSTAKKAGVSSSSGGGANQTNKHKQQQEQKQQKTKPPNVIKPVLLSKGNGKSSSTGGQKAQQQNGSTNSNNNNNNNNSKNVMDPSEVNLNDFYMCRMDPAPVLGQPRVDMPGLALPLTYQCAGEEYNQFATLLEQLIRNKGARGFTWGKRKRMLPYQPPNGNNNANNNHRRLLIMGNSHTRQVAITLLCQYRHQVLKTTYLFSTPEYPLSGVIQIDMTNNLTVYVAANCPFVYTQQWNTILEGILKQPLSAMNAIVVGNFNQFQDSKNTFFYKSVMSYQEKYPDLHLDFENQKGPQVEDLVKLYDGPIVHVSMFAENFPAPSVQEQQRQAGTAAHRVKYIDGRKYIDGLKKLQHRIAPQLPLLYEGASNETPKGGVAQVETNVGEYRFSYGHRCVGARGGHVDLIAWDVVTALYKMIPKQGNTGIQVTTRVQE